MMTRLLLPLSISDISSFAKQLKAYLDERHAAGQAIPSHLELLNLLARAAGFRNFQTLRATATHASAQADVAWPQPTSMDSLDLSAPAPAPALASALAQPDARVNYGALTATVRKALMQFDTAGRLVRLPNKLSVQHMAMWWMWTHFTVRRKYSEKEVNQILNAHHTFGDQATLRRELVNMKLLGRKSDCSEYWKEPVRPDPDVQDFLRALRQVVAGSQPARAGTALTAQHKNPKESHATT